MSIKAALRRKTGSHLHPPKAASPEPMNRKARQCRANGCSLDIGTFNEYGALPDVKNRTG